MGGPSTAPPFGFPITRFRDIENTMRADTTTLSGAFTTIPDRHQGGKRGARSLIVGLAFFSHRPVEQTLAEVEGIEPPERSSRSTDFQDRPLVHPDYFRRTLLSPYHIFLSRLPR